MVQTTHIKAISYNTPVLYKWVITTGLFLLLLPATAQIDFTTPGNGAAHVNVKFGGYGLINGGFGISAGIGFWTTFNHFQPACNLSINLVGSKANLGNRDRYLTNWQVNAVLTPMLTAGISHGLYQEINPFYFGTIGAVYADYQHSITIGSNFIVMPRAVGRNITTYRNRTQQVAYLGLRSGGQDWDLNLNIYDDFLYTDNAAFQGLADNFDRFYTGGGNLQFRTRTVKIKQYADIYTGNFQNDLFDNPDLYHPYRSDSSEKPDDWIGGSGNAKRHPRYVAQDPGQKLFNVGRNFTVLELSPGSFGTSPLHPTLQLYGGWQGGRRQMLAQNIIHSLSKIDKINPRFDNSDQLPSKADASKQERLHWFSPAYKNGRFITGAGLLLNTVPRLPN